VLSPIAVAAAEVVQVRASIAAYATAVSRTGFRPFVAHQIFRASIMSVIGDTQTDLLRREIPYESKGLSPATVLRHHA